MAFKEYPKMIYREGKGVIVNNKDEEAKLTGIVSKEIKEEKKTNKTGWDK